MFVNAVARANVQTLVLKASSFRSVRSRRRASLESAASRASRQVSSVIHRTSPGRGGGGPAITNIDLLACSDDEVGEDFLG